MSDHFDWYKEQTKICVEQIDREWAAIKDCIVHSGGFPPKFSQDTLFPNLLRLMAISNEVSGYVQGKHEE